MRLHVRTAHAVNDICAVFNIAKLPSISKEQLEKRLLRIFIIANIALYSSQFLLFIVYLIVRSDALFYIQVRSPLAARSTRACALTERLGSISLHVLVHWCAGIPRVRHAIVFAFAKLANRISAHAKEAERGEPTASLHIRARCIRVCVLLSAAGRCDHWRHHIFVFASRCRCDRRDVPCSASSDSAHRTRAQ
jgi:hypothetical protein